MIRRTIGAAAMAAALALAAQPATAQGFSAGYTDIGPTIAIGNIGSASIAFGGRFEHGLRDLPDFGNGVLGIQVGATYYSWSSAFASWSYIPIGVTGNYHFNLENDRIDPFIGLGLGYQIISCSWDGPGANLCSNSAIYFIGRAGIRYFMTDSLALYADAGAGGGTLNAGAMFRIR